jgi:hypothetical protein
VMWPRNDSVLFEKFTFRTIMKDISSSLMILLRMTLTTVLVHYRDSDDLLRLGSLLLILYSKFHRLAVTSYDDKSRVKVWKSY